MGFVLTIAFAIGAGRFVYDRWPAWREYQFRRAVTRLQANITPTRIRSLLPSGDDKHLGHGFLSTEEFITLATYRFQSHWYCVYLRYPYEGPVTDLGPDPRFIGPLEAVRVYRVDIAPENYKSRTSHGGTPQGPWREYIGDFFTVATRGQPNDPGITNELIHVDPPAEELFIRLNRVEQLAWPPGPHERELPVETLIEGLKSEHAYVRREAAGLVGWIGPERAGPAFALLSDLLEDKDERVRQVAADASTGRLLSETIHYGVRPRPARPRLTHPQ